MEIDLLSKSVNAREFLKILGEEYGWFVSYSIMLAQKHFEDPSTKKIYVGLVFIGDYRWDIHTIRFEEVVYEKDKTKRREVVTPPNAIAERALKELRSAYDRAKELPPEIEKRLKRAQNGQ
ncbi:MAG: hypothetical protein U9M97_02265 [Candidatus Hadarchaeota archaeon]|nr:hypothetical protein [Candidatus Hadarchaeota archaeon]